MGGVIIRDLPFVGKRTESTRLSGPAEDLVGKEGNAVVFGRPPIFLKIDAENEELEFPGNEVDGGIGEGEAVVAPDPVELFFVGELNSGEELPLLVVERDKEGVEEAVGGVLDADQGVDLNRRRVFDGGVVIKGAGDVVPAGGGGVETEVGRFSEADDEVVVDALDAKGGTSGVAEPVVGSGPLVGADGEAVEIGGVEEPGFGVGVSERDPEGGKRLEDHEG